ncbi:arginase family protein [Streptomyces sp. NBC_01456]|uniref:arginase family protein n=1 Tax=unclassified Streptomyces TaxID=2593676 RepID=UPI002E2ED12C|nr:MULTISPECIES: arginase family protein [unclassified Streptomyces]
MAEIDRRGVDAVLQQAIDEALDGPEFPFVSLDIDVLDPAFAPGTGTPEPPGLTNRELLPALRRICHETPVVGMDIVEVAPHLDPGYTTTMNARRALFEALTGIAMRRKRQTVPVLAGSRCGGGGGLGGRMAGPLAGRGRPGRGGPWPSRPCPP